MPPKPRFSITKAAAQPTPAAKPAITEPIGKTVRRLVKAIDNLKQTGLNEEAILILLAHKSGIGRRTIEKVIEAIHEMGDAYLS